MTDADNDLEIAMMERKQRGQKRMAWTALVAMIASLAILFLPIISNERVEALDDIIGLFFISCAGITGAFMGMTAFMNRKK